MDQTPPLPKVYAPWDQPPPRPISTHLPQTDTTKYKYLRDSKLLPPREGNVLTAVYLTTIDLMATRSTAYPCCQRSRYASYWNAFLLSNKNAVIFHTDVLSS